MKNKSKECNSILAKVAIIISMFLVAALIIIGIFAVKRSIDKKLYKMPIYWDELSVDSDAVNRQVKPMEGMVSLDDYIIMRQKESFEGLSRINGILPDNIVGNITEGIESKYYLDSIKADYNDLCDSMGGMIKQCEYIKKLYSAYQNDVGIEDINYCAEYGTDSNEKCELYVYFTEYATGNLKEYFLDAHNKWESIVSYYTEKEQLDESYIDLYYQDEICTNLEYIKKLNVEVIVLNNATYSLGLEEIQKAKDNNLLSSVNYNEYMIHYLTQLNLYRDINFYDGDMAKLADKTISSLFTTEAIDDGSLKNLGKDLSGEELKNQLEELQATASNANKEELDIGNYQVLEYSLTGRDPKDVYYILYKVKESEHDMSLIPSKEDMLAELTMKGKAMMAQQQVSDIIMAEINDIDITDTENLSDNVHTHKDSESETQNYNGESLDYSEISDE